MFKSVTIFASFFGDELTGDLRLSEYLYLFQLKTLLFAIFCCFIGSAGSGSVALIIQPILHKSVFSYLVVSLKNGSGYNDQYYQLFHDFLLTSLGRDRGGGRAEVRTITTPWIQVFESVFFPLQFDPLSGRR